MSARQLWVLDANVLYPFQLRILILHMAAEGLYRPLWSTEILAEVERALRRDAGLTDQQVAHLFGQLRKWFPAAYAGGYEGAADGVELPDEGDRHVVALALAYEADGIVTSNQKHFPAVTLAPFGTTVLQPDAFCLALANDDLGALLRAAEHHRTSLTKHPMREDEYLQSLRDKAGLKKTSQLLLEAGFLTRAVQRGRIHRP